MSRKIAGAWFEKEFEARVWEEKKRHWRGEVRVPADGGGEQISLLSEGSSYEEALAELEKAIGNWRETHREKWRAAIAKQKAEVLHL